ncbi:MAG TPA: SRPBCC family protein [Beijerinckiaceae bacterium]|jgi:uncharacterized protein YndB with AHSA1/START domain
MSTLTVIAIVAAVLVAAVAAVLVLASRKPATFRIARSIRIAAPPERIFGLIEDFRAWSAWSPWENRDPALKRTYAGLPRGQGAVYAWEGNRNVGQGRMEIVDASAPSRVTIKLDFLKPFEAHNTAEFTLVPQVDSTEVTWAMTGPNVFMGKVMGVFVDMDRMIGRDFEQGLANLKAAAEGSPPSPQAASA